MTLAKGAGRPQRGAAAGFQKQSGFGKRSPSSLPPSPLQCQPIRAEIAGDDTASAGGITVKATAPVIALCRKLVEAGHDPATPLEAYRGATLCLRVRSIGEAGGLEINGDGTGFRRRRAPDAASPIAKSVSTYVEVSDGSEAGL